MSVNETSDIHREMIEALTFQRDEALASVANMSAENERLTRERDALRSQNDSLYHSVINARAQVNDLLQTAGCVGPDGIPFKTSVLRDRLNAAERKVEKLRKALKPFAALASTEEARFENCIPSEFTTVVVFLRELRNARAALKETE